MKVDVEERFWLWCWEMDEREKKGSGEAMGDGPVFIGRDWGRVASHQAGRQEAVATHE